MPTKDPFAVLGVTSAATPAMIKAAWRRLAREHHPDLAGDPLAARRATRRMAEINAAYEELRDPEKRRRRQAEANGGRRAAAYTDPVDGDARNGARSGPPRPRASRPVTGRLDTSELFVAFQRGGPQTGGLPGHAPIDVQEERSEPPRASDPTGPTHRRQERVNRPAPPSLAQARGIELEFGKFRGHTLGQVVDFEPSYVDWIARTITRDPDLVAAARVLQADLDLRGIVRQHRGAGAAQAR